MLKKCSIPSSATIRFGDRPSAPSSSSVTKYIASPARIASRVFGCPSRIRSPSAIPSIVRSPPVASSITSRSGPPSSRQQLDGLLEPHRDRAGPLVQQLVRAVDGRVEDPEAARPGREHRLEADRHVRVAELARRGLDLGGAVDAPERRRRQPEPVQERVRLGLVVRAEDRVGLRHEHGHREASRCSARPSRSNDDCGRTQSAPSRSTTARIASAKPGSEPAGNEVERVAEVAADRALGHVGADEAQLALAVLAQRAQQRSRARARPRR